MTVYPELICPDEQMLSLLYERADTRTIANLSDTQQNSWLSAVINFSLTSLTKETSKESNDNKSKIVL